MLIRSPNIFYWREIEKIMVWGLLTFSFLQHFPTAHLQVLFTLDQRDMKRKQNPQNLNCNLPKNIDDY